MQSFVLMGLESAGKSTLFNLLTESAASDERNFRGSTVVCREGVIKDAGVSLVDTPGIRFQSDSETTALTLNTLTQHDGVILVLRATDAQQEWQTLSPLIPPQIKQLIILLTFADKIKTGLGEVTAYLGEITAVPVMATNARDADSHVRQAILPLILGAKPAPAPAPLTGLRIPIINLLAESPQHTLFEYRGWGQIAAIVCLFLLFAVPVWAAWLLSDAIQPVVDNLVIDPLKQQTAHWPAGLTALFVGNYGLFSLGLYSFIWAFPVVLLVGLSLSLTDDSGLKERITTTLDPWLRKVGLSGQDLIPVLSGFGCNVVAVFQSRSCSRCTRQACISMISFGSACSYQTGATLSLFNAAHHPWLFVPYPSLLFITGALHTRLWNRPLPADKNPRLTELTWLQWPRLRNVVWMLKNILRQFLLQAMPLFLIICLIAQGLDYTGITRWLSDTSAPLLHLLHLPAELMPGIIFSLFRKDGLMVLNQDGGSVLQSLSTPQLLLLIWLASTLMACLVTVFTIAREINWRFAALIVARQALSSLAVALMISLIFIHGA
ncbi:ferrous iron transporter B [Shimwellia pseudoproteus]|uniref:nucleoside recognition domain-containing protein n=1 Tax=Shimwellia pseudoproteus TaxID=570012 RepID=UPI0018EC33B8|nr:nucleoside recognition domain-containing protein [Shimwellia pseudoproteus]MBJ3814710.1 ferrous iron transporter B [Shimwellia pseudoproteus]